MLAQQPKDDEVAVPPVHFVELAAWDHVRIFEIQQTFDGYVGISGSSLALRFFSEGDVPLRTLQCLRNSLRAGGRAKSVGRYRVGSPSVFVSEYALQSDADRVRSSQAPEI